MLAHNRQPACRVRAPSPLSMRLQTIDVCLRLAHLSIPAVHLSCAGFVKLYQEGELIQAFITCSFFSGTVAYGITHQRLWGIVERLELSVWSLLSAVTSWLVIVLGRRVYTVSGRSELVHDDPPELPIEKVHTIIEILPVEIQPQSQAMCRSPHSGWKKNRLDTWHILSLFIC